MAATLGAAADDVLGRSLVLPFCAVFGHMIVHLQILLFWSEAIHPAVTLGIRQPRRCPTSLSGKAVYLNAPGEIQRTERLILVDTFSIVKEPQRI